MSDEDFNAGSGEGGLGDGVDDAPLVIDPTEYRGSDPVEPIRTRRKRSDAGQSRGTGKRTGKAKQASLSLDLSSLTGMFIGLHAMAAMQLQSPELSITDDEGKAFTLAAQNVLRHYSVETTQKTLDWVALMGMGVGMYGTRIVAIANRRKSIDRVERPRPTVVPMRPERREVAQAGGAPGERAPTAMPTVDPGAVVFDEENSLGEDQRF